MQKAYFEDESLNKAKKEHGLHFTDAFRYLVDCFLYFERWQDYLRYYGKKAA